MACSWGRIVCKRTICLFLLWLTVWGVVSCSAENQPTPVSFIVFGDPAELAAYEALVAAFESAEPTIAIDLRHIPDQGAYRQRLASDFASRNSADIFLLNYRRFALFAEQGGIEPLGPYLAESELISAENFFDVAIDSFTWRDTLWCIPQNVSSLVVYYNRDLFDAAGAAYPTDSWRWEQFVAAAQQLTVDQDGDGRIDQYGASISPSIFRLAPFVWQLDGQLVDDVASPTRLTLDSAEAQTALAALVALQTQHGVVPDRAAEQVQSSQSRFLNGSVAMMFNSRRGVPTYRSIDSFMWDVAPLPQLGSTQAGILHSDAYCMAARSENKAAAWRFIEFANSAEGQHLIAQSGRTVPSLRAVAASEAFLAPDQPPQNSRVFVDTVPILRTVPQMAQWVGIEETVSKEIERAFYGEASLEEVTAAAIKAADVYFARER